MPYEIKKQGNSWVKINKETGKVKSHHSSKAKAIVSIKASHINKGLNESPDNVKDKNGKVIAFYSDKDAGAFTMIDNNVMIYGDGKTHYELANIIISLSHLLYDEEYGKEKHLVS